jgi:DNA (cytosine-5)-methyltransferase 1
LKTTTISAEQIAGKCFVQHPSTINNLEEWLCHENHFYIQDFSTKPSFIGIESCDELQTLELSAHSYCRDCYKKHIKTLEKQDLLKKGNKPLQALEIFSGSFLYSGKCHISHISKVLVVFQLGWRNQDLLRLNGQLSMHQVLRGHFSKYYFYNLTINGKLTIFFRINKKHTKVYNQDCNLLLEHAIQFYNGKNSPPLRSLDDGKQLPPLPRPGEVDLICGGECNWKFEPPLLNWSTGPPCQGFSGANRHPVSKFFLTAQSDPNVFRQSDQMTLGRPGYGSVVSPSL